MSIARRAAMRLGFGAALAAPSAAAALRDEGLWKLGGGGAHLIESRIAPYPPDDSVISMVTKMARKTYDHACDDQQFRARYRVGAFDHDIAACQSWSLPFKAAMQRSRDRESLSFLEKLRIEAWG